MGTKFIPSSLAQQEATWDFSGLQFAICNLTVKDSSLLVSILVYEYYPNNILHPSQRIPCIEHQYYSEHLNSSVKV